MRNLVCIFTSAPNRRCDRAPPPVLQFLGQGKRLCGEALFGRGHRSYLATNRILAATEWAWIAWNDAIVGKNSRENGTALKIDAVAIQALNLILWGVYCLAYVFMFSGSWTTATPGLISYTVLCSVIGVALCAISWQFAVGPIVRRAASISIGVGAKLAAAAVALGLLHAVTCVVVEPLILGRLQGSFESLVAMYFISFVFIYCLVFCCGVMLDLVRRDGDRRERLALAEGRASRAQLMALRLQINPHFVFNALNAVSSLIALDRKSDAEEMVQRLSRFLRGVTETSPHDFSELRSEIEMAEEYLSVEAVRFQDRLNVVVETQEEVAEFPVPNFILQPLVENAVKHGVARNMTTTDVIIRAEAQPRGLRLTVDNCCSEPLPVEVGTRGLGIGMINVRERLWALYGDAATIEAGRTASGFRVTLDLPRTPKEAVTS